MVSSLIDAYPDRFAAVEYHVDYNPDHQYYLEWAKNRSLYYGLGELTPVFMVDGFWNCPDGDYGTCLGAELGVPTDVTIDVFGTEVSGQTWRISADVCIEASGAGKTMRIYTAPLLDHYPDPPDYSRNTLKQAATTQDVVLAAGECQRVITNVTFDSDSLARPSNIVVTVWAQAPNSSGPANVFQAAQMRWPFPQAPQLTTIEITPATASLNIGDQLSFTAVGKDQFGSDFSLNNPSWSLSGDAVGSVDPASGSDTILFTATAAGTAQLMCSQDGVSASAAVDVSGDPAYLAAISISPAEISVEVGGQVIYTATGTDQYGNDYPLAGTAWSISGDGDGYFVPPSGAPSPIFFATSPGVAQVTCEEAGLTASATVTITGDPAELTTLEISPATATVAVGSQVSFTATGTDQYGNDFPLADPVWSLSGDGVGSFDPASGSATTVFTASEPGSSVVSCVAGGLTATASLEITGDAPALASLEISPADVNLVVGQQVSFTATGTDQNGDPYTLVDPQWRLDGLCAGSFDPAGGSATTVFTATGAGSSCTVVCSEDGIEGSATVDVVLSALPAPRRVKGRVGTAP